jgi:hypothetical protein
MPPKPVQKAKARHEAKKKDEKIKKKKKEDSDSDEESEEEEPKKEKEKKIEKPQQQQPDEKTIEAKLVEFNNIKQSMWNEVGKLETNLANTYNKYLLSDGVVLFNFKKVSLLLGDLKGCVLSDRLQMV